MTKKEKEALRQEAIAFLKEYIKAGQRVYTSLDHVSSSGMSRRISVLIPTVREQTGELEIFNITHWAARALGYKVSKKGGMVVGGCGMDMGFHVVYSLGSAIWGHGKDSEAPRQNYVTYRNGSSEPEMDGGYLLKHSWV